MKSNERRQSGRVNLEQNHESTSEIHISRLQFQGSSGREIAEPDATFFRLLNCDID